MRYLALCLLLPFAAVAFAQQPPYDQAPLAEPPYYQVRYEASEKPGELIYPVVYTVWIPADVKTLKGVIVHQHGCGEGSCKSGQTGAYDLHWQALARRHQCALLSPAYEQPEGTDCQMWCDPRNGSDATFQQALADLGKTTGHPELNEVPWALWGHSGGGHWAGGMSLLHPERVAAAWLRSGVPYLQPVEGRDIKPYTVSADALAVPRMCNLGTKEGVTVKGDRFAGVWPSNQTFFEAMRKQNALIGIAVDPLTAHECGNQRYLAILWLDACLTARLPKEPGQPLLPIDSDKAWLATTPTDSETVTKPFPASGFSGDLEETVWLPNERVAKAWQRYGADTQIVDSTPPPAPRRLRIEGGQLVWDADADLESGISHFVITKDGVSIGSVPEKPKNSFGRPLFQGLQYSDTPALPLAEMRFTLPSQTTHDVDQYQVHAVNTVGLTSK
ncbi:hypothetical protein FF011L_25110 [Roseimaritima multifibrata]|uniref:Alpha/beta hydrolase family protein n=1 Tax=Roseimaritima multifibrata TaxID=1930274 RepID=A0A517MFS8_9BACT|nr:hypothetical protein [Roseimaritima multifibrata]QDS93738.1 hypothetical protein FF011L_25110 [Roseimaritima multifibrata]